MASFFAGKRICVTGGAGFLGRAVCARVGEGDPAELFVPRSRDFDLTTPDGVARLFDEADPEVVIHLAAEIGGIDANEKQPGRFFYANMAMGLHLIEEARRHGVDKFVQVGTARGYPKLCEAPFGEDELWNGYPDDTYAAYGVAKRALGVMLDAYRTQYGFNGIYLVPVDLYGPHDNFDPQKTQVIPALVRKFCDAVDEQTPEVECWGTGLSRREFLYVDDAAEAIVTAAATHNDSQPINLGTGQETTIADLAVLIAETCGYTGAIMWDTTRPDGSPRRGVDTTRAARLLNWHAQVDLEEGLRRTVEWWRAATRTAQPVGT